MNAYDDAWHLGLDELADLLAGEGSETAVAHLESCVRCAGQLAALDEAQAPVAAALRALPPPPVPADLTSRLDAAFAAEGPPAQLERRVPAGPAPAPAADPDADADADADADDSAPPSAPARPASTTVTPLPRRRATPGGLPGWLPAAAAAVLVLGAGVFGLSQLGGGDEAAETASAPAGESAQSDAADALAGVAVNASGRDYAREPGALAQSLPAVLAGKADPGPGSAATPGLERLRDPAGLASCLSALLPPGDPAVRPLALDYAAYGGQPALVVVLPAADPAKVDVFVVGAGCEASNDATLFFARLDRPR